MCHRRRQLLPNAAGFAAIDVKHKLFLQHAENAEDPRIFAAHLATP